MDVGVDAVAYKFGRLGGLIDVSFGEHDRVNRLRDRVVVGFRTSVSARRAAGASSRLLVTVVSATSNDFVQLSLVRRSHASTGPGGSSHAPARPAHRRAPSFVKDYWTRENEALRSR